MIEKIGKTVRSITLISSYFTVFSLISLGVSCIANEALSTYAIIVFTSAFVFFIFTTAIYVIGPKKKNDSNEKKQGRKLLKFVFKLLKIWIIILPLFSFTNAFALNFTHPGLLKVLSILWLIFQIGVEISLLFFKLTIKKISNKISDLKEEKKNTKKA